MKSQNIVLVVTGLIIGGLAVALFTKFVRCEPNAQYVVDWQGAGIADKNIAGFKEALGAKAVFTHHFRISHQQGGENEAKELENTHIGRFCFPGNTASAPHVTQRAGFNSFEDLKTLESYLTEPNNE